MRIHEIVREAAAPITDTPAFQNWFAGSKIVNADGSPMVLYHGTSKDVDFKAFKAPKNGIWFTPNRASASEYAMQNDSMDAKYDWETGKYRNVNQASRVIPVFIRALNPAFFPDLPEELRSLDAGETGVGYRRGQAAFFERLRAKGHDAMVVGSDLVVVFDPTQVKSAIGNRSFNPAKKGMTEARAGN